MRILRQNFPVAKWNEISRKILQEKSEYTNARSGLLFLFALKGVVDAENVRPDCSGCYYLYSEYDTGYSHCEREWEDCPRQPKNFICTKTGKKMYYAYKVHRMRLEKRESIISRCDCQMPQECEWQLRKEDKQ